MINRNKTITSAFLILLMSLQLTMNPRTAHAGVFGFCGKVFSPIRVLFRPFSRTNRLHQLGQQKLFVGEESARNKVHAFFKAKQAALLFTSRKSRKKLRQFIEASEQAWWDPATASQVYDKEKDDVLVIDAVMKIQKAYMLSIVRDEKLPHSPAYLTAKRTFLLVGSAVVGLFIWANATQVVVNGSSGFYQIPQAESQRLSYQTRAAIDGVGFNQVKLQVLQLTSDEIVRIRRKIEDQAVASNSAFNYVENDARDRLLRFKTYVTSVEHLLLNLDRTTRPDVIQRNVVLLTEETLHHFDVITGPAGSVLLEAVNAIYKEFDPEGEARRSVYQRYF